MEKDNIIIDGAGYMLQGSGTGIGIGTMLKTPTLGYSQITIKNLQISAFRTGIHLSCSSNNIIRECNVTDCTYGVDMLSSSNNTFDRNIIRNNTIGIDFEYSPNNTFTNNLLDNNAQPLRFETEWSNSIDTSNMIDGKPIYFIVNQKDLLIDPTGYPQIGYLAIINCTRITIKNLNNNGSQMGIIMVQTTNSTIAQNNITNHQRGIYLYYSSNISINENQVTDNEYGIMIETNLGNMVVGNYIANNDCGIFLTGAPQTIYHNNFVNNTQHATADEWVPLTYAPLPNGMHIWDNGSPSGGNYWSDYNGIDSNHDSIGDTVYIVSQYRNNTDHYPLMTPVNVPEFPSWTILLFFIISTSISTLVYWKKRKS